MMKFATFKKAIPLVICAVLLLLSACGTPAAAPAEAEPTASAVDTIMTVGTTQAFSDEAVPAEDIQTILRAGLAAESAINQQPWFFAAVTDQDVLAEISASGGLPGGAGMPSAPKDGDMPAPTRGGEMPAAPQGGAPAAPSASGGAKAALGDSPLAIIVYKDESTSSPNPDFDCGLAVQNMYIAAASLGYGAKIISSPTMTLNGENHDQICEKLGVDPSMTAVAVLLIGKPDASVDAVSSASTRADLDEKASIIG